MKDFNQTHIFQMLLHTHHDQTSQWLAFGFPCKMSCTNTQSLVNGAESLLPGLSFSFSVAPRGAEVRWEWARALAISQPHSIKYSLSVEDPYVPNVIIGHYSIKSPASKKWSWLWRDSGELPENISLCPAVPAECGGRAIEKGDVEKPVRLS